MHRRLLPAQYALVVGRAASLHAAQVITIWHAPHRNGMILRALHKSVIRSFDSTEDPT